MSGRDRARDALLGLALAALGALLPALALRSARSVFLDFGPNDADYIRGFRQDWERDGRTRFHWTSQAANVVLPLRVAGDGPTLRLRFRRHLIETANVKIAIEGRTAAAFEAQADPKVAYRTLELSLPALEGRHPFVLSIEAPSESPRPLGLALDWLELVVQPGTLLSYSNSLLFRFAAIVLAAFALPRLGGAGKLAAASHALILALLASALAALDPLAFERVAHEGMVAYLTVGALALLITLRPISVFLGLPEGRSVWSGALVILVLTALAIRLALLLHPRFYYPDVRIHSLFALGLARRGAADLGARFIENQYRLSLGLQQVGDHWYPFPYPPGFYLLATPLISWFGLRAEVAVSLLAAVANSLETLLVFAIGRALALSWGASFASSALVPLLPLFVVRLSLGYFPSLAGHLLDAFVVLVVLRLASSWSTHRTSAKIAVVLGAALLIYVQSFLNFAVLLVLLAGLLLRERGRTAVRPLLGLLTAGLLAGTLSFVLFYARYVPVLDAMRERRPIPEESIMLNRLAAEDRARQAVGEEVSVEEADPFSGSDFSPLRGLRKAGWRLFVFYGWAAPVLFVCVVLLVRFAPPEHRNFVVAWALSYVALNVLSGSLPGPNLFRYNKDLEFVAPLACLSLGAMATRVWNRTGPGRILLMLAAVLWAAFCVTTALGAFAANSAFER